VSARNVQLGLGLIGIGREWGHANAVVPPESEAMRLLERAVELGVQWLDTAPSYGASEERLGKFLRRLSDTERGRITVATKFGEEWDAARGQPFVDHTFDGLRRSLDRSLDLLGRVDVLQLHKTNPAVLRSEDLGRAWEYALAAGVRVVGASVSDLESAEVAIADRRYGVVQLPFNAGNRTFERMLGRAEGLRVIANRPFGMGALLYGDAPLDKQQAFEFMMARLKAGDVILTGTKSPEHLADNVAAFAAAQGAAR
jgi:aryl-alcohol dehydrogenase-like predicted oxidoreductase